MMAKASVGFANKTDAAFARVDRRINRFGRTIKKTLGTLGLFVGLTAGLAVIGNAVTIIADYEQANANLASVLGINIDKTLALQDASKKLGATTAFTAAEVASLQTEFAKLGFSQTEILGATEATLSLAAATRTELPQAAKQVGAAIRAFGLDASEAARVSDVFAKSTSKSALDMEKLDVSMSKIAPVSKQFGLGIEDTIAFMGKLADAGFDASTMATSMRSILLNLADGNGKLAKSLGGPARTLPEITKAMVKMREKGIDLADMLEVTDKRSVAAFATLLEGAEGIDVLADSLKNAGGFAQEMAEKQLDTLTGRTTILNSAYQGLILSLDDGNGVFSRASKRIIEVTTDILSLASGLATNSSELDEQQLANRILAKRIISVVKAVTKVVAAYLAMKVVIFTVKKLTVAYNIVVGIFNALQGKSLFAIRANSVATKTHIIVTKAAAAATKIWNFILSLNPIGLVLLGVVALTGGVILLTKAFSKQSRELRLNGEVQKRAMENTAKQRAEVVILFTKLRALKVGSDEYAKVLEKIESLQPGITEKHNLQAGALENVNKAEKELTKSILERAKAQAIADLIQEKTNKLVELQFEGPSFLDQLKGFALSGGSLEIALKNISGFQKSKESNLQRDIEALINKGIPESERKSVNDLIERAGLPKSLQQNEAISNASLSEKESSVDPISIDATKETIATERSESIKESRLGVTVNGGGNDVDVDTSETDGIPVETFDTGEF